MTRTYLQILAARGFTPARRLIALPDEPATPAAPRATPSGDGRIMGLNAAFFAAAAAIGFNPPSAPAAPTAPRTVPPRPRKTAADRARAVRDAVGEMAIRARLHLERSVCQAELERWLAEQAIRNRRR